MKSSVWLHGVAVEVDAAGLLGVQGASMMYKIALTRSDEGFSVSVPGLPGCWSQGTTEDEALANVREAITEYLAVRDELLGQYEVREVEVA